MQGLTVVFSSHLGDYRDKTFVRHIASTSGVKNLEVMAVSNFGEHSLASIYNNAIKKSNNKIIAFIHNDIEFMNKGWGIKLLKHFKNSDYSILGVAGTHTLSKEKRGCWWSHPKGGPADDCFGAVWHINDSGVKYKSDYGKSGDIDSVVAVDGLFIAVDRTRIKCDFIKYEKFHFYDIPFCVENHKRGCGIGVVHDIEILHKSIGKLSPQWHEARDSFVKYYPESYSVAKEEVPLPFSILHAGEKPKLPIAVVVPLSKHRETFFRENVLPKLFSNGASKVIIVTGDFSAPKKRNFGFSLIGDEKYVFFCDDDIVLPDGYFDALHKSIDGNDEYAYAYTGYNGIVKYPDTHPAKGNFSILTYDFDANILRQGNYISTMALLKKEYFPLFDERLKKFQDWDLWLTILNKFGKGGKAVHGIVFDAYYLDEGITSSRNKSPESIALLRMKHRL